MVVAVDSQIRTGSQAILAGPLNAADEFPIEEAGLVLPVSRDYNSRRPRRENEGFNAPYHSTTLGLLESEGHIQAGSGLHPDDQSICPNR